jgi:hypothetical protein
MLIVFLFAAVVAIMLYRELPVTLFEAQRQKEQLLVDRGHEYIRAVQLYYRRNKGQYPASVEQLENTSGVRFLRHRFKDPLTGKDDWRLLHAAGPGGQLIDSKVNPLNQNGTNSTSAGGQNAFGSSGASQNGAAQSGFAQSGFGHSANPSSDTPPEVLVQPIRQRAPAVLANGSGNQETPTSADLDQNPATPLLGSSSDSAAVPNPPRGANGQQGASGPGAPVNGDSQGPNVMQALQPLLTSGATGQAVQPGFGQNGQSQQTGFGQTNGQAQMLGGGALAGVASKAGGHTIKLVNDQTDYSLWEFYYDPSKDKALTSGGGGNAAGGVPTGVNSQNSNNSSGFGSNSSANSNSGFGNTSPVVNAGSTGTDSNSAGQPTDPGSGNTVNPANGNSTPMTGPYGRQMPLPAPQSQ